MTDKHDALRAALDATRRDYHLLANAINTGQWRRPSGNPAWTVGEVMFHMTVAPRFIRTDIFLIRRLGWVPKLPVSLFDWLNRVYTRAGARGLSPATVRDEYDVAHHLVLETLYSIGEGEWGKGARYPVRDPALSGFVTIEQLFLYLPRHFEHHAEQVRRALG